MLFISYINYVHLVCPFLKDEALSYMHSTTHNIEGELMELFISCMLKPNKVLSGAGISLQNVTQVTEFN